MRAILVLLAALILSGCAQQAPRISDTPWPQVVLSQPRQEIRDRFLSAFAQAGASIETTSESLITSRGPDDQAATAKLFFGCPSCGDPYIQMHVVLSTTQEGTLVVVQYWRAVPKINGTVDRMEMGNAVFNQWQKILWDMRDNSAAKTTAVQPQH